MKLTKTSCALLCCLGFIALPAQAIISCSKTDGAPAASAGNPASTEAGRVARLLAGTAFPGEVAATLYGQYIPVVNDAWQAYAQTYRQPLGAWSAKEVRQEAGRTVFYPFSGPDLPSVQAIFPTAIRFVMISDQHAGKYFDPFAVKDSEQARLLQEMSEAWASFGKRGFFVTQELNKRGGGEHRLHLTPSMILMAFAVRLGYEVRSVQPVCVDASDLSIRPVEAKDNLWSSVRIELRKDGRDIIVDYLQQDLSNRGLGKRSELKAVIESLSKGPVLLKAASHLPQQPGFTTLRNAILTYAPLIVQDETGLEYDTLSNHFNVKLYGEYVGAHRLFKEFINPSLIKAYKERAREVRPLDFKLGYEKEAGSAIQVASRK